MNVRPDGSPYLYLLELDEHLERLATSHHPMALSQLDGFVAAMLACPRAPQLEEWLPVVWGGQPGDGRAVENADALHQLVRRHVAATEQALREDRYRPIFDIDAEGNPQWFFWAIGFGIALAHYPGGRSRFEREQSKSACERLLDLSRLALGMDLDEARMLELEDAALGMIPECVAVLYDDALRMEFVALMQGRAGLIRPPRPVALGPKIGRNGPCPCGSGQKYRNCCRP